MTQDEIIEMARQAGIAKHGLGWTCLEGQLEAFAKRVAAKEQDRCCSIIYGQCGSDNVAERTVQAIKGKKCYS